MTKRVSKALPLTLAFLLAVGGAAFGGDNAGVVISFDKSEVSGLGAGESFTINVTAAGMVQVRDVAIELKLDPVAAFNTTVASSVDASGIVFTPGANFAALAALNPVGITVDPDDASLFTGGGSDFLNKTDGDAELGTFTITMADDYDGSESSVTATFIRLGQNSADVDDFLTEALGLAVAVNPPAPAPTIASVDPAEGFASGNTVITISGANFQDGATVTVGDGDENDASGVFVDANTMTATVPNHPVAFDTEGVVADVVVTNPDGQSANAVGAFTWRPNPAPAIASVDPVEGFSGDTTEITISGANFLDGATVTVGEGDDNDASGVFVDANTMTATVGPAPEAGVADVVVTNPDGQSVVASGAFTWFDIPPPTITSIDPAEGTERGGTAITISGADFQDGATVTVGGNDAAGVFVDAATLTATIPAGTAGGADVVVTNPDDLAATAAGGFTYLPVIEPTLSAASATDASVDFSPVGSGAAEDGSDGEVTFTAIFTDATGGPAISQEIIWEITNHGSEPAYLVARLGEWQNGMVLEIPAGSSTNTGGTTGENGTASATFDAEGDRSAGSTSISVTASTTADNSEGESRDLGPVTFTATWDVPVAAELASVTAGYTLDSTVFIEWAAASQTNNLGWEVYRSVDQIRYTQVGDLVPGDGTLDGYRSYSFLDIEPPDADVAFYYLKQLDLDGKSSRSNIIEVALSVRVPTANVLLQNFPNPFNPETIIGFDLVEESAVSLTIYDATGQIVATLADGDVMRAGYQEVVWNGLNRSGSKVASGVYFYQLHTAHFTSVKRMTLIQ